MTKTSMVRMWIGERLGGGDLVAGYAELGAELCLAVCEICFGELLERKVLLRSSDAPFP